MGLLCALVLVLVAAGGAAFALENPQLVDFGYFAGRTDVPVSACRGAA